MGQSDPIPGPAASLLFQRRCWCGAESARGFGKNDVAQEYSQEYSGSQAVGGGGVGWLDQLLLPLLPPLDL